MNYKTIISYTWVKFGLDLVEKIENLLDNQKLGDIIYNFEELPYLNNMLNDAIKNQDHIFHLNLYFAVDYATLINWKKDVFNLFDLSFIHQESFLFDENNTALWMKIFEITGEIFTQKVLNLQNELNEYFKKFNLKNNIKIINMNKLLFDFINLNSKLEITQYIFKNQVINHFNLYASVGRSDLIDMIKLFSMREILLKKHHVLLKDFDVEVNINMNELDQSTGFKFSLLSSLCNTESYSLIQLSQMDENDIFSKILYPNRAIQFSLLFISSDYRKIVEYLLFKVNTMYEGKLFALLELSLIDYFNSKSKEDFFEYIKKVDLDKVILPELEYNLHSVTEEFLANCQIQMLFNNGCINDSVLYFFQESRNLIISDINNHYMSQQMLSNIIRDEKIYKNICFFYTSGKEFIHNNWNKYMTNGGIAICNTWDVDNKGVEMLRKQENSMESVGELLFVDAVEELIGKMSGQKL